MNILFILLSLYFFSLFTYASGLNLEQKRKLYAQASELQKQGDWDDAQKIADKITDYPLAYLLEYQSIADNINQHSFTKVEQFVNRNPKRRVSFDLERSYLLYLAKNAQWNEFLAFYPKLPNSINLKCFHFQAKIQQNLSEEIWPAVQKVWLTGRSLPDACDAVFTLYQDNQKITEQLIWQRYELAFINNSRSLMRYLMTLMNNDNKTLATQLYAVNKNPETLLKSELFENRQQVSFSFLQPTLKRLAKKDLSLAMQTFNTLEQSKSLTAAEHLELKKYFAVKILLESEEGLFTWLDENLVSLEDDKLIELRIRYAIKFDNWHDIEYWLTKLPQSKKQRNKWIYWQARVFEKQQQQEKADNLYQKIAGKRSYYSFLAAQKLGANYKLNAQLVTEKTQTLVSFKNELAHIEELFIQQYNSLLKREWRALLNKHSTETQLQLGYYAKQKGWTHLSILASINSKSWNALNIRFPEVEANMFAGAATQYQLAPSYIYAITRQESAFDEFAKSPVGASGYMQLMPATAKQTAKQIGMKNYKKVSQLTDGEVNINLGTAYFDMLLKRYDGNRIIATAAYNAGPNRVDRWQGNKKGRAAHGLEMDSWIETIPYKETRRYVKNVLAYNVIYQHVLDKPREFFNQKELLARF